MRATALLNKEASILNSALDVGKKGLEYMTKDFKAGAKLGMKAKNMSAYTTTPGKISKFTTSAPKGNSLSEIARPTVANVNAVKSARNLEYAKGAGKVGVAGLAGYGGYKALGGGSNNQPRY